MAAVSQNKKRLDDLEKSSDSIKRDYDQFFLGLSKRPPTTAQAQFAGQMRKIKEDELREWNTQDKFRFNQIHARFVSMERVWARELKQVEDGTHKRDKLKVSLAKKRDAAAAAAAAQSHPNAQADAHTDANGEKPEPTRLQATADPLDSIDLDMNSFDDEPPAAAPAKPAAPKPQPRPAVAAAAPRPANGGGGGGGSGVGGGDLGGLSEQRLQMLYKVYMDAKKRTGEASNLSVDALRSQIAKQVPQIRQKHGCEQVDFKVVLKDGKAMLKAIPK